MAPESGTREGAAARPHQADAAAAAPGGPGDVRPFSLLAELTYRCPLQCPYCYNPLDYDRYRPELATKEWRRVIREADALGVVQVHFSGGEPLVRRDLPALVRAAAELGAYTNLITGATLLTDERLATLKTAGLANVQISIQAPEAALSDRIAGASSFAQKLDAARRVKAAGLPLTVNTVLHRLNLDAVDEIVALAEGLGADRLELANAQYYGWAHRNRAALMPTGAQLAHAEAAAQAARTRLAGRMDILYVLSDYYEPWPKPCMDGWARRYMTVTPTGTVLPCPAAHTIRTLRFADVREAPLEEIWYQSPAMNAFRGTAWMPEPCRSCPRKTVDYGGCRCQAYLLTGDAAATDPVCTLSPHHGMVREAAAAAAPDPEDPAFVPRRVGTVPSSPAPRLPEP